MGAVSEGNGERLMAPAQVTQLLGAARRGDAEAERRLYAIVYGELRRRARQQLRRFRPRQTLNTTALVHEAYLKVAQHGELEARDREHFFALSARVMRQIVIDYARRFQAARRGLGAHHTGFEDVHPAAIDPEQRAHFLLALDAAIGRLAEVDERLAKLVELRFYAGLSVQESARLLGVSTATVKRDTRVARAFLARELDRDGVPGGTETADD